MIPAEAVEAAAPYMLEDGAMYQVASLEALAKLPAEAVIRDKFGAVLERHQTESGVLIWLPIGSRDAWGTEDITTPAWVLYVP